ncbi:unnamed protein product [Phytomonas sp. EM1]|nr:unnamed protein product [Phytomonas sp. EM1]|eukprot:CCW61603.1 unnamed protein product [Phytomonas sp. isolate EM1]
MSLLHRIHGARFSPALRQAERPSDGLRGVFTRRLIPRGALILSIPLPYVYFPHGLSSPFPLQGGGNSSETRDLLQLRRCNRQIALFPEFWTWLRRLSPDVVVGEASEEGGGGSVALSASASLRGSSPAVVTLTLSPVEAAIAICVGVRYFFASALAIPRRTRVALRLGCEGATAMDAGEIYVRSLPIAEFLRYGVEGFFQQALGDEANAHSCLEQLAWNLRDACLTYATAEEYRLIDANPSTFDEVLLAVLYIVRARVFQIPLLLDENPLRDRLVRVYSPGLDSLNHAEAHDCTAAAVVSARNRSVVVRAVRDIRAGEEITFDYSSQNYVPTDRITLLRSMRRGKRSDQSPHEIQVGEAWASRYLFNRD